MLSKQWIDPRTVDWTDPFNPLARPRWYETRNPAIWETMQDPIWQAIRQGRNMEPRLWTTPIKENATIGGLLSNDEAIPCDPGTWLYGISGSGDQTEGFLVQITDATTGVQLFSQPASIQNLTGSASRTNGVCFYLRTPMAFVPPSYPIVRIINLSQSAQKCQVVLWTALQLEL